MRQFSKILIYLMLLVLLTAEDCGFGSRKPIEVDSFEDRMFHELERSFVSEEMGEEQLQAMEKRAIQKFYELVDYLNIYADSGLDIQFRKQARQMISEYFVSKLDLQGFMFEHKLMEDLGNSILLNTEEETVKFRVETVRLIAAFERNQNSEYRSRLTYQFQNSDIIIGVLATKTTKSFGNEKLDVWELFFEL